MAAELAGMASIGIVHAQLANPTTAPLAELGEYFYAVAKLGLDTAIVYNPLRAVKLCTLIAMYNIIIHATVALAYLDLGIILARKSGIDATERRPICLLSNMTICGVLTELWCICNVGSALP